MNWLRNRIRRWLDVREIVLREIDADQVWRNGHLAHRLLEQERAAMERDREIAVLSGKREDTADA